MKILLIILFSLILISSCDLPHEPGPMPSEIVETEYIASLNILGVLRADNQVGTSFININRTLTTEEIYSDTVENNLFPDVEFAKINLIGTGVEYLFLKPEDSTDLGNYRDTTLNVQAGETYDLEISAPGFPVLTGETSIPQTPQLVDNTLSITSGNVSFHLQHDVSAFEYKAYIIFANAVLEKVIKPSNEEIITVDWDYSISNGTPLYLTLSALDENLTRYGNSPISFLPNTYHPDGSTVRGGYGCFGSVAITTIEL